MLTSGRDKGTVAELTLVSCPDQDWVTFSFERQRWTPELWEADLP